MIQLKLVKIRTTMYLVYYNMLTKDNPASSESRNMCCLYVVLMFIALFSYGFFAIQ